MIESIACLLIGFIVAALPGFIIWRRDKRKSRECADFIERMNAESKRDLRRRFPGYFEASE